MAFRWTPAAAGCTLPATVNGYAPHLTIAYSEHSPVAALRLPRFVFCIPGNSATKKSFTRQCGNDQGERIFPNDYLVALDLPGHGDSPEPAWQLQDMIFSFDGYAAVVWEFIRVYIGYPPFRTCRATIPEVIILGWSLGGQIAYSLMHLAAEAKTPPFKLSLVVTWGAPPVPNDNLMAGFLSFPEAALMGQGSQFTLEEAEVFTRAAGLPVRQGEEPSEFVLDAAATYGPSRSKMIASCGSTVRFDCAATTNAQQLVGESDVPLCIVMGKQDGGVNNQYIREQRYKNAVLHEVDGNHALHYNNYDEFYAILAPYF